MLIADAEFAAPPCCALASFASPQFWGEKGSGKSGRAIPLLKQGEMGN